ncbi:major facilitator superfamily domain-containing protein, partial [Xylogone sp. PMI_703]
MPRHTTKIDAGPPVTTANVQHRVRKRDLTKHDDPDSSGTELDVMDNTSNSKSPATVREQRRRQNNSSDRDDDLVDFDNGNDNHSESSEDSPLLGRDSFSGSATKGTAQWDGLSDFEGLPWWKAPSVYWVLPPFFLFAVSWGGILVPKLNLILSLICRRYLADKAVADPSFTFTPVLLGSDNPQCRVPDVQALVSKFMLWITIITGSLSAIVAPKYGALSDRYGRLKLMVLASAGMLIGEVFTIMAATYPDTIHHKWLLVGSLAEGICGSFTTGMAMVHAYAADITHPSQRNVAFGYFSACLFCGIAIGPLISGYIVKTTGSLISIFYVALGVHIWFIIFLLIFVPESLSRKKQLLARQKYAAEIHNTSAEQSTWLWALKHGNLFEPLKILWPTGPGSSPHL